MRHGMKVRILSTVLQETCLHLVNPSQGEDSLLFITPSIKYSHFYYYLLIFFFTLHTVFMYSMYCL